MDLKFLNTGVAATKFSGFWPHSFGLKWTALESLLTVISRLWLLTGLMYRAGTHSVIALHCLN